VIKEKHLINYNNKNYWKPFLKNTIIFKINDFFSHFE